jgi:TonB family protein
MTPATSPQRFVLTTVMAVVLAAAPGFAQDSLEAAKDLYASAAYEDALAVLARLQRADARLEIDRYRAFCLIALGRTIEADKAIQSVVSANPSYVPDPGEVPPRIQEAFARTRKQLLPDIARRMYVAAKMALDRKDRDAAISGFDALVRLIDSTAPDPQASLSEMRLLAAGFLDLSRALPVPEPEKPASAPVPSEPPSPPAASSQAGRGTPAISPPVATRQVMPAWIPPDSVSRVAVYNGSVRVVISPAGKVEAAEMVKSVHPVYDRLLVQAARAWEYQPARLNGSPIVSEQVVQVQLKPRE